MKQKGFNLIELMIVVVIIGIIASIAVPAYQDNVVKSSRGDGMTTLLDIMRAQENFFANEYTYTTNLTELNYSSSQSSASGKYKITASACGAEALTACVRLTATAQGGQASDGNLTLDSRGNRTHGSSSSWPK
ncbi:MAG: prepilin-type N-terminal cleavage/methylation domain-containing protein [Gammaproteobacteria bacterium]|nr:prepilin-type N-terminal cleavage/methylation domain-containing protein [Gammaproteobacteria bacterium]